MRLPASNATNMKYGKREGDFNKEPSTLNTTVVFSEGSTLSERESSLSTLCWELYDRALLKLFF